MFLGMSVASTYFECSFLFQMFLGMSVASTYFECSFLFQMFLGMSVAGTYFDGYFFAFHLLNVVNNNQLLSGVIKAVTLNGIKHCINWNISFSFFRKISLEMTVQKVFV